MALTSRLVTFKSWWLRLQLLVLQRRPRLRARGLHGDCARSAWEGGKTQIYIQPHPFNRRVAFHQTMGALDNIRRSTNMSCEFYVEAVQYQQAATEEIERRAFSVRRCIRSKTSVLGCVWRPVNQKRRGNFLRKGAEQLIPS